MSVGWANGLLWRRGAEAWAPGNDPNPPLDIESAAPDPSDSGTCVFALARPANVGAPTLRGTGTATASSLTLVVTLTTAIGVGERAFAAGGGRGATADLVSVADARGNTWALDKTVDDATGNNTLGIASAPVTTALQVGDAVTMTFAAGPPGPSLQGAVFAASGIAGSGALDKSATSVSTWDASSHWTGGSSGTLSQADELVIGAVLGSLYGSASTPDAGYATLAYVASSGAASGDRPLSVVYGVVGATTAVNPGATISVPAFGGYGALTVTYKAALVVPGETIVDSGTCSLAIGTSYADSPVLDSFNAGAAQALSARTGWAAGHWSGSLDLRTDAVPTKASTGLGTPAGNIWADNLTTDHEAVITWAASIATAHLLARVDSATSPSQGYVGYLTAFGQFEIETRGGSTLAITTTGPTAAVGDSFRLRCVGRLITLDYKPSAGAWTNLLWVIDGTYTTGTFIGIHAPSGSPEFDSFGGGVAAAVGTIADAGTCTLGITPTAVETVADAATNTAVFSFTASESLSGGSLSDAGTATFVVTPTATEVESEAATNTMVIAPSAAERLIDAGSVTCVMLPASAVAAITDASVNALVVTQALPLVSPVLDDFNSGATQALSARAGWAAGHWSGSTDLRTDATPTKATASLGTPAGNIWAANLTTDHEAVLTWAASIATSMLLARVNSTTAPSQGYVGYLTAFGTFEIQTRGGLTLASTVVGPTAATGDSFRLRCVGSLITLDYKAAAGSWTNLLWAIDSTYTTGTFIGVHAVSGSPEFESFGGGAVVATGAEALVDAGTCIVTVTPSSSASSARWQATHETGDYSEWDGDGWGGDFSSGPGTYAKSIDTVHAHSGTYSLKMQTDTTLGQAGQRNFRWAINVAGDDLPVHALYTTWFYFDQVYAPLSGDWNIMQWKTKRDSFGSNDPDWCVGVYNQASSMQLYMYDFHLGSNHGAFSPIGSLTPNTWHKVEVEYLRSGNPDGMVRAWLDGVLFADLSGVVTRWPTSELGHFDTWSINNYTSKNTPDASTIWADDASIAGLPLLGETLVDAGTCSFALSQTAGLSDSGTATLALAETASETVVDAGSQIIALTPTAAQTVTDAGTCVLSVTPTSAFIWPDSGTCTFVVLPSAAEQVQDASTVIFVLTEADSERESDQGTVPIGLVASGAEALVDSRSDFFAIARGDLFTPDDLVYPDDVAGPDYVHGFEAIIDAGSSAVVVSPSAAEVISEGGSTFVTITPVQQGIEQGNASLVVVTTALETISEAGTATMGIASSAAEQVQQASTATLVLTPTETESLVEAATCAVVLAQSSVETTQDAGAATLVFPETALSTDQDAGTATFVLVATASEAVTDSGTVVISLTQTEFDAAGEAGTCTIAIAPTASETLSEAPTVTLILVPTAVVVVSDSGATAFALIVSDTETQTDAGTAVFVLSQTAFETTIFADSGTCTLSMTPSATERISEGATATLALTPTSDETITQAGSQSITLSQMESVSPSESGVAIMTLLATTTVAQPLEAGTCTFSADGVGAETLVDVPVTVTFVVTPTYFGGAPGAAGNQTITLSQTAVETIVGDPSVGTCVLVIDPSHTWTVGFDPYTPTPLQGGDSAERRRQRVAALRAKANASTNPEHRDRKLARR